jgi:hypothetical protein
MFMEGCENAFPSNKEQESSKTTDRDSSDQVEDEDDARNDSKEDEGTDESRGNHRRSCRLKQKLGE